MRPSFAAILQATSDLTGVSVDVLKGDSRNRAVVHARAAAVVVARSYVDSGNHDRFSYPILAKTLGKDHSTLVYHVHQFSEYCRRDPGLVPLTEQIRLLAEGRTPPPRPLPPVTPKPAKRKKSTRTRKESAQAGLATIAANQRRLIAAAATGNVKPKNDFTPDADHDDGHLFHANVAAKNDAFLAALRDA